MGRPPERAAQGRRTGRPTQACRLTSRIHQLACPNYRPTYRVCRSAHLRARAISQTISCSIRTLDAQSMHSSQRKVSLRSTRVVTFWWATRPTSERKEHKPVGLGNQYLGGRSTILGERLQLASRPDFHHSHWDAGTRPL